MPFSLHGLPVSGGIAIGHAHLVSHALLEVHHYQVPTRHLADELVRLSEAVVKVHEELAALKITATAQAGPSEVAALVDLHIMLLEDPMLVEGAKQLIETRRYNAEWALVQQMEHLVEQFDEIEDAYLRERKADVVQVVERLLKALLGHPGKLPPRRKDGFGTIVVAHDLSPADTIHFKDHDVAGFITDAGGPTSHTAIVARSMGIPAVVALHHIRALVQDEDLIIVDGLRGVVIIAPDKRILEEYQVRRAQHELERTKLNRLRSAKATTLDGEPINLFANIEVPQDVQQVKAVDAAGIGLFRSEFLFIGRNELPGEDEQFEAYRTVAKALHGKPVVIRTLDVGADKALNGETATVPNPALGLRGIRYCLSEPQMFLAQLRALLRASAFGQIKIMVPMLAHAVEIDQTLNLIERAKAQLRERNIKFNEAVQVGGMIEVPAAALALGMFLRRVSFLSIGTNDLIQYTLAIDRTDSAVTHLYDPLHPAVLRLISGTIQAGARVGVPVSVCGEMAGETQYSRLLLGMGLRQFSMHPAQILSVKHEVLRADIADLVPKVQRILRSDEPEKIKEAVSKL
jgi:phosphotransferase system enzyme I (PtsI)